MYTIAILVAVICPPLVVLFVPSRSWAMFFWGGFATCWGWVPSVILAAVIVTAHKDSMD